MALAGMLTVVGSFIAIVLLFILYIFPDVICVPLRTKTASDAQENGTKDPVVELCRAIRGHEVQ